MFRYVALIWNPSDDRASTVAQSMAERLIGDSSNEWQRSFRSSWIILLCTGMRSDSNRIYMLPNGYGAVVGTLFQRREPACDGEAPGDLLKILDVYGDGRCLLQNYWGGYVAFARGFNAKSTYVIRDPQGGLPCFVTSIGSVRVFFSDVRDCLTLGLDFSVNWEFIAAYVCEPTLRSRDTGLENVSEVLPGEGLEVADAGSLKNLRHWDPTSIARAAPSISSFSHAVAMLREATQECVWAWASCHPRILHRLSGGLDSSIVLSCLRSAPTRPEITCLHYFDPSFAESDERYLARLAAEAAGCELVEVQERSTIDLSRILDVARSVRPRGAQYSLRHGSIEREIARQRNISALSSGIGGDQVFYQRPIPHIAVDSFLNSGLRGGAIRILMDIARSQQVSVWRAFRSILRVYFSGQTSDLFAQAARNRKLLHSDVVKTTLECRLAATSQSAFVKDIPPGKAQHIRMMMISANPYDAFSLPDDPERIVPLLSQPLIETCISIPTYLLAFSGVDRAAARQAFAHEVPRPIVVRRTKGGIDGHFRELVRKNLRFLREVMLDGIMVREGLLDPGKLEACLREDAQTVGPEIGELLCEHLNTEAWLRSWLDCRRSGSVVSRVA
jgi:asparagine synthase (glutamine-hydrolysing)